MILLQKATEGLMHLFFPHLCSGCGSDAVQNNQPLCLDCIERLPETGFEKIVGNHVEKVFYGRLPVRAATAFLYFSKDALVQQLLHQLKYKGNTGLGEYLGRMMGMQLKRSERFQHTDVLVPVPLNAARLKKRGYNQAEVICNGISETMGIPVATGALVRQKPSETQTRKTRTDRWENMKEIFLLEKPEQLAGKNMLLVDDVVTTGATLEACGRELVRAGNLDIACLAYTL
jgi:ComF family protein